ncbi:receptor-like protein kinase HERK 1 [Telopea speciosissima]|uniref:receptor-like protein kinase HERK 1 n=1 Tax=Telopea speciosissima TaxID=54955 RepID=UPI001CC5F38E|nr:receptor-like protein kinase HERK 1 [Telopea speciosissima]
MSPSHLFRLKFHPVMGVGELKLLLWILSVLSLVLISLGFVPKDNYLIDCGSSTSTTVMNHVFVADNSQYLKTQRNIMASTSNSITSIIASPLYQTARIFNGTASYNFPISNQGRHWIRLYFFPFQYQEYNMSMAIFSVTAQNFVLLGNFNPRNGSMFKEYSLPVTSDNLVLSFTPAEHSFAFLNALEVVSVPDTLITDNAQTVNPLGAFQGLLMNEALQTVWRVNMGGPLVTTLNDTLGRTWVADQNFIVNQNLAQSVTGSVNYVQGGPTRDIAPDTVYGTATEMNSSNAPNPNFNMTWKFNVDAGFQHLIRFHFCDIVSTALNNLYFNVYVNSWVVAQDLDLSLVTVNTLAAPYYMDFVLGSSNRTILSVSVGPSTTVTSVSPNAILNGLEIMKMSDSKGSLDGEAFISPHGSKKKVGLIVGVVLGVIAVVFLGTILFFILHRSRRLAHDHPSKSNGRNAHSTVSKFSNGTITSATSELALRFAFVALQEATNNFDESLVIGVGGFGKVYKGVLKDETTVAVKRANPLSKQGLMEFQTEIEMLSQFRHRHLVSLIGYCDEQNEMILVYEYMENGTLKNHLYGQNLPSLSWKQRLEICIGSAKGLHYLHTGSVKAIIHRDVKSANILLDENLKAKVADFGLSKAGPEIDQTHVSTAVKGSFGYLDPEYFKRQQLTEKSDVYSFGVVLLEVFCARPVIDPSLPREKVNLAEWAMQWQKRGELEQIIDPNLAGKIRPDSLRKFAETAEKCLAEYGVDRPTMGNVLFNLEYALQLQDTTTQDETDENSTNQIGELSPMVNHISNEETSLIAEHLESSQVDDFSGVSMSKVFSQLVKAEGR